MATEFDKLRASSQRALAAAHGVHTGMSLFLAWRISDRSFADALVDSGLTPRQYSVLLNLAADAPLSQRELVDRVGIDRSGMGRQIDDLERRGLVERRAAPGDRRAHAVHLTPAGAERLRAADRAVEHTLDEVYSALTDAENAELGRLLTKLVEHH
ncbi:MarR family winged helix-turn-helix transcriptional regulator [Rhodococcus globerulus]|uniref:MarR family transcriptional regulator n=1 Tax=Rhodococcus globerulus TaxID=33008 RepID=A0ABU4C5F1_RHOGO|nr:MarR family transcriptional regulator [Rhodococcus globerulus]MDV6271727.1 MarR family transcriptional regulator [Rhodococcus globerulus]